MAARTSRWLFVPLALVLILYIRDLLGQTHNGGKVVEANVRVKIDAPGVLSLLEAQLYQHHLMVIVLVISMYWHLLVERQLLVQMLAMQLNSVQPVRLGLSGFMTALEKTYLSNKGDLWKLPISDFHFNDSCITVSELQGIAFTERSFDGWHIDSVVTFLKTGSDYLLYSEDFDTNHWIDGNHHFSKLRFDLTTGFFDNPSSQHAPLQNARFNLDGCLCHLYVMAFTSGVASADVVDENGHSVELRTANETRSLTLYDRPGDDYFAHKGDMWKLPISDFHFTDPCITFPKLQGVALLEHSFDGWQVESVVTFLRAGSEYEVFTTDIEVNEGIFIDGDKNLQGSTRRLDLTFAINLRD